MKYKILAIFFITVVSFILLNITSKNVETVAVPRTTSIHSWSEFVSGHSDINIDDYILLNDISTITNEKLLPNFDPTDPYYIRNVLLAGGNRSLIGHNEYLDYRGIVMIAKLCANRKIKSYITHSARVDRTTLEIGYFENIRIHGDNLIGDFRFFQSAIQHRAYTVDMLLEMIKIIPDEFGVSVVMYSNAAWVLKDGTETLIGHEESKPDSDELLYDLPVLRPIDIVSFDWVQSGALTHEGVFLPSH
jgi:hypothetical protein